MTRILLICSNYPVPENTGSNMRTMHFVRFFKHLGTVDIAYSHGSPDPSSPSPFAKEYQLSVRSYSSSTRHAVRGLLNGIPSPIYHFNDSSRELLAYLFRSGAYDYILIRYLYNTGLDFSRLHRSRLILDFDDVLSGSLYDCIFAEITGFLKGTIVKLNRMALIRYERKCLALGASLFCSEKDRMALAKNSHSSTTFVVPNVYDNSTFSDYPFGDGTQKPNTLLYVGTLNYKPNVDGLLWFLDSVYPQFRTTYADARFLIVGSSPSHQVTTLAARLPGVELFGNVPDVRPYYAQCRAFIVPLFTGGGTRIKLLEAALARRPIYATPRAIEGLDLTDGRDVFLFDTAETFLARYSQLLQHDQYNSLVRTCYARVSARHTISHFTDAMQKVLTAMH